MKNFRWMFAVLALVVAAGSGCSTTSTFKIPQGDKLVVTDREATPDGEGKWTTSPFFWSSTSGARYALYDANGKLVRSGKLKTHFRAASIFWPPLALIYWPMGLHTDGYDLTVPADGYMVVDDSNPVAIAPAPKKKSVKN